jgi:ribosomal protein S18 acetylase RimI-like enzyme
MKITSATIEDLEQLIPLFDEYRKFYRKEVSPNSGNFLKERISQNDSTIFLAREGNSIVGFVQLYYTFSSLSLGKVAIINDLFVEPKSRKKKIGSMLISQAIEHGKEKKVSFLTLSTQIANTNAQELYKKLGFKKDNDFFYFNYYL